MISTCRSLSTVVRHREDSDSDLTTTEEEEEEEGGPNPETLDKIVTVDPDT